MCICIAVMVLLLLFVCGNGSGNNDGEILFIARKTSSHPHNTCDRTNRQQSWCSAFFLSVSGLASSARYLYLMRKSFRNLIQYERCLCIKRLMGIMKKCAIIIRCSLSIVDWGDNELQLFYPCVVLRKLEQSMAFIEHTCSTITIPFG